MKLPDQLKYNLVAFLLIALYAVLALIVDGINEDEVNDIYNLVSIVIGGQLGIDGVKVIAKTVEKKQNEVVKNFGIGEEYIPEKIEKPIDVKREKK